MVTATKIEGKELLPLYKRGVGQTIKRRDIKKVFPFRDTGDLSPEVMKEIARLIRKGKVITYLDYTFPKAGKGYALRRPKYSPEKQVELESLRSLSKGAWRNVPTAQKVARLRIKKKLPVGTMDDVMKTQEARSVQAKASDSAKLAKYTMPQTDAAAGIWLHNPAQYDIKGIDTPAVSKITALKHKTLRITPKTPRLR